MRSQIAFFCSDRWLPARSTADGLGPPGRQLHHECSLGRRAIWYAAPGAKRVLRLHLMPAAWRVLVNRDGPPLQQLP